MDTKEKTHLLLFICIMLLIAVGFSLYGLSKRKAPDTEYPFGLTEDQFELVFSFIIMGYLSNGTV